MRDEDWDCEFCGEHHNECGCYFPGDFPNSYEAEYRERVLHGAQDVRNWHRDDSVWETERAMEEYDVRFYPEYGWVGPTVAA